LRLFHVSERADIEGFEPRRLPGSADDAPPVVWAIDEEHLDNYLLSRDCPRVCFRASAASRAEDVRRFLGSDAGAVVVAIESGWEPRARSTPLHLYRLPAETFTCQDRNAGYFVSSAVVSPLERIHVARPLDLLHSRGAALRVLPSLWPLHDEVAASTLAFSMIRMRNAAPRI
jgi:hypothetical protein